MSHDASVEQQVLATIDKWVEQELRPIAREFDQADEYPSDLVEQMKELGLFGATISEEYGGLGLNASTYARIVSRICTRRTAFSLVSPVTRPSSSTSPLVNSTVRCVTSMLETV